MEWIGYLVALVFFVLGVGCVFLVIIQLPGGWLLLALAGLVEWLDMAYLPAESSQTFPLWVWGVCFCLLVLGEVLEFAAGVAGARKGGGSRRGMWGALIGGIAGAFILTPIFFFLPLFGTLFGAILGSFLGAIVAELTTEDATLRGSLRPATGAAIGRVIGTLSKVPVTIVVWLLLTVAIVLG